MTTNLENGIAAEHPWAKEATNYLARLSPEAQEEILVPLTSMLKQWPKWQSRFVKESHDWPLLTVDSSPWVWEIEQSSNGQATLTTLTFTSIDGFLGYLDSRSTSQGKTPIIVLNSANRISKGSVPQGKRKKFDWCMSVVTLAILGSRWKLSPDTLFPSDRLWHDIPDTVLKRSTRLEIAALLEPTRLLSRCREHEAVSARPLQTVETQYFAVTRSQLPPESFVMPAFKAHHDKPLSHSLQLIKISQSNGGLASDKCILVCDSQESRKLLQDSVASEPYPGDGSSLSFSRCLQDFFIDCSFRNLVLLEYNLEKVKYRSRADPSYHMLNYVLYLWDHLKIEKRFLEHSGRGRPTLLHDQSARQSDQWSIDSGLDQEFLRNRLNSIELEVQHVQDTIKTQIESKNASRNFLFAILASLYLPFSLATGVFGMNIREINNATPKWSSVLAFGLPLAAVTVMMPLSFGYSYRKVSVFISRNQKFSRRFIIFGGPVLGVSSIIVAVILSAVIVKQK